MTIGIKKLIGMAEQIAVNITMSNDTDLIAGEVAGHLKKFWDPRMLSEFVTEAEGSGVDLSAEVAAAIEKLRPVVASTHS